MAKLCAKGKAAAKRKFKVYPSAKNKQRIDKLNKEMKTGSFTYDGKFRYK